MEGQTLEIWTLLWPGRVQDVVGVRQLANHPSAGSSVVAMLEHSLALVPPLEGQSQEEGLVAGCSEPVDGVQDDSVLEFL